MVTVAPLRYDVYIMPTRTGRAYNSKEPTPGTLGFYVRRRRVELAIFLEQSR